MNRFLRVGAFVLPFCAIGGGLVVACSDDTTSPLDPGGYDASPFDGSSNFTDGSYQLQDAGADSNKPLTDAGKDAADAADAADSAPPTPLCTLYPSIWVTDAGSDPKERWERIAYRSFFPAQGAAAPGYNIYETCEVSANFPYDDDSDPNWIGGPPANQECLIQQLKAIAGCKNAGVAVDYEVANDISNGAKCTADGGLGIRLGFRDPPNHRYTDQDVDKVIDIIRANAIDAGGLTAADADRLKAQLQALRNTAVRADAGPGGDAGYSAAACEPPI
jgi:hypothetical protein